MEQQALIDTCTIQTSQQINERVKEEQSSVKTAVPLD
jgi:hypothetical protein